MNDTSSTPPVIPPTSSAEAEVLVGQVNAEFEPLKPEDIVPVGRETETTDAEAAKDSEASTSAAAGDGTPPLKAAPVSSNQQLLGCLRDILLVLISVVLGAAFALILLLGLNGTLFLNDREKAAALEVAVNVMEDKQTAMTEQISQQKAAVATLDAQLQEKDSQLQDLNKQTQTLEAQIQSLEGEQQQQAGEIDALQARSDEVEQGVETIRQDVAGMSDRLGEVQDHVEALDGTVTGMKGDIEDVKRTAERFDRFVKGLVALVADVAPEELRAGEAITVTVTAIAHAHATETPVETTPEPFVTPTPLASEAVSPLGVFPPQHPIPAPARGSGVIFGVVWLDANGNGAPDAGESVLPGSRISLADESGVPLLSMVSGVDGRFAFINVPPGDYQLQVSPPDDQDLAAPKPQTLTVSPDSSVEVNFGLTPP